MLGNAAVWLALTRDKRGPLIVGTLLLFLVATLVWNLLP